MRQIRSGVLGPRADVKNAIVRHSERPVVADLGLWGGFERPLVIEGTRSTPCSPSRSEPVNVRLLDRSQRWFRELPVTVATAFGRAASEDRDHR